eukprot:3928117-Pleurochrysis_carterae.AAC.2
MSPARRSAILHRPSMLTRIPRGREAKTGRISSLSHTDRQSGKLAEANTRMSTETDGVSQARTPQSEVSADSHSSGRIERTEQFEQPGIELVYTSASVCMDAVGAQLPRLPAEQATSAQRCAPPSRRPCTRTTVARGRHGEAARDVKARANSHEGSLALLSLRQPTCSF